MKKLGGFLAIFTLALSLFSAPVSAACANTSTLGAVELSVPTLPDRDKHELWVRLQSDNPNGRLAVEINGDQCLEVSGGLSADKWTWHKPSGNSVTFARKQSNTIKLIGESDGLKIDRVLLTEEGCMPRDFGNNCQGSVELEQSKAEVASIPPPNSPVTGEVTLSQTPENYQDQLESVEYVVDARVIQTVYGVGPFDTTLIGNGKYTVQINTKLRGGSVVRESTTVDIRNQEHFYSASWRWVRHNVRTVKLTGLITVSVFLLAFLFSFLRKAYRANRERKFHGF